MASVYNSMELRSDLDIDSDTDVESDMDQANHADSDFQPSRSLCTSLIPAPKRKHLGSLDSDDLAELNINGAVKPASKRAKTKKSSNNGSIKVNFERLKEQIASMPGEIQELIMVQCIATRANNVPYVQVFLSSRDVMLHSTNMYKAICDTEVVLTGKNFLKDFRRLHPAVVQLARKLKIVYITEDIPMPCKESRGKHAVYVKSMAIYQKFQDFFHVGLIKAEFAQELPDAPASQRHKQYPMGQPRLGSEYTPFLTACRKFTSVHELTIDFTSHITYNGVDKETLSTDQAYGNKVGAHLHAAIGFIDVRTSNHWDSPKLKEGKNPLKKLTLILGTAEVSKDEVSENAFAACLSTRPFTGPVDVPNWQWLRFWFTQSLKNGRYDPAVHTPFTEFSMNKKAGTVSYSRQGYKGYKA